jgi:hypothetical protein
MSEAKALLFRKGRDRAYAFWTPKDQYEFTLLVIERLLQNEWIFDRWSRERKFFSPEGHFGHGGACFGLI